MENPQINPSVKKEYRDDPFHQVGLSIGLFGALSPAFLNVCTHFIEVKKSLHSIKIIFL